jgi:thiamine kinase-like enzyme
MPEVPLPSFSPDEAAERLRVQLRRFAATNALARGRFTAVAGGLSNLAWRVDLDGDSWFVRLGNPDAARLGVDRRSECAVLQAVAAAGIGPVVLACQPEAELLVTHFIGGSPWQAADAARPANLRRLAQQLRRLHALPPPAGCASVDFTRQALELEAVVAGNEAQLVRLREAAVLRIARLAAREPREVLCHNDLHHLNIVDDGERLWLVDWEYAGRGDPLFDLAGFLAMHELDPAATAEFVGAYGRLDEAGLVLLDDARWVFDYVQWLWYRARFRESPADATSHAEGLAQRLLRCNN